MIIALPLELFRAILAEAMHARTIKRAIRIRLVNRFFADEVMYILQSTRFLEDCDRDIGCLGSIGPEFMARRLLHTNLLVCDRWRNIRSFAKIIADEDDGSEEAYAKYVTLLCYKAAPRPCGRSIKQLCGTEYIKGDDVTSWFNYDLICAAIYFNKLTIVEKLGYCGCKMRDNCGIFGSIFGTSIMENNHAAVDILFKKTLQHCSTIGGVQARYMRLATKCLGSGAVPMTQKFLRGFKEYDQEEIEDLKDEPCLTWLEYAYHTSNIETFLVMKEFMEKTPWPIRGWRAKRLMARSCWVGGEKIFDYLVNQELVDDPCFRQYLSTSTEMVSDACAVGSASIVRRLLELGVQVPNEALGMAAERLYWHLVWWLIDEHGANPNAGVKPPIVWAIKQERKDIISKLLERGATLDGDLGVKAAKAAQEDGLESMLVMLESLGVNVEEALKADANSA